MADNQPQDDDSDSGTPSPELSDREVDLAFSELTANFGPDHLSGPRDYRPTEEPDGFIPPDPGPVTSTDAFLTMGWFLLAGGLLTILISLVVWPSAPRAFSLACVGASLVGGGILVWRMPHHKDDDDDLGAVV